MEFKGIELKNLKRYQKIKNKRYRSAFTTNQINCLENEFQKCPYIGVESRKELANIVKIPERAIKIWFQNRRMKEKKCSEREVDSNQQNTFVNDSLINLSNIKLVNDHYRDLGMSTAANYNLQEIISKTCNNFSDCQKINSSGVLFENKKINNVHNQIQKKFVTQRMNELLRNNLSDNSYNSNYDESKIAKMKYAANVIMKNFSAPEIKTKDSFLSTGRKSNNEVNKPKYIDQYKKKSNIMTNSSIYNRKQPDSNSQRSAAHFLSQGSLQPQEVNTETIKRPVSTDVDVKTAVNTTKNNLNCNCICNCCRLRSHCNNNDFHMPYMLIVPTCGLGKNNN